MERIALSRKEAAQALGICPRHLEKLIKQGQIPSVWLGRRRVIPVRALEEFLSKKAAEEK